MQRTRPQRPILRPKSSRTKRQSDQGRQKVTREEDFSLEEERNFATEPEIMAGDQFKTKPGDPAKRAELQASQESETGVRQPGEQWSEGAETEERFRKQVRQAKEDLRKENRQNH